MAKKRSMRSAVKDGDRREQLETLLYKLAKSIDSCEGHGMAALAREYRETLRELNELDEETTKDDPIGRIVAAHRPAGADLLQFPNVQ